MGFLSEPPLSVSNFDDVCISCEPGFTNIVHAPLKNLTNENMAVDGSAGPIGFFYTPPPNNLFLLFLVNIILYGGTQEHTPPKFAGVNALANGVDIRFNNATVYNFKTNHQLLGYLNARSPFKGVTPTVDTSGICDYRMAMGGRPVLITEGVEIRINDDIEIQGLYFHASVHGFTRQKS